MFFIAILGTYIVLRAGAPHLFSEHAAALSKPWAGANTLVLIFSSLTMALAVDAAQKHNRNRVILFLSLTFLCAFGFMCIKGIEYQSKVAIFGPKNVHHTIIARDEKESDKFWCYDGHAKSDDGKTITLEGVRMPLTDKDTSFNPHLVSEAYVEEHPNGTGGGEAAAGDMGHAGEKAEARAEMKGKEAKGQQTFVISKANINTDLQYGPWKNIFYSCYFTLTGIHGLHVLGGMVPIGFLLIQAMRGKVFAAHTEYVGLYWHFVDLVWIFLFPLLYLI
jgi:cytochrome c oxidase subunit 3